MKKAFLYIILFISNYICSNTDLGIKAQSFGGAYSSVALSNDVIFYNPAGILKSKKMAFEVDYERSFLHSNNTIIASIVDSKTTDWALGLLYYADIKDKKSESQNAYLTVAMPIVENLLSLGSSLAYKYEKQLNFMHMDFGLLFNSEIGFASALVFNNAFYFINRHSPVGISLASSYDFSKIVEIFPLILSCDWLMKDAFSNNKLLHELSFGSQFIFFEIFAWRMGYKNKFYQNSQLISLGAGLLAETIDIDFLYSQDLLLGANRNLGVSIKLMF